jgi:hypothetical protein
LTIKAADHGLPEPMAFDMMRHGAAICFQAHIKLLVT